MSTTSELTGLKPAKWVKQNLFCTLTGHTVHTISKNRSRGVWTEGVHYKRGPEGRETYYYNIDAIDDLISRHK